MLSAALGLAWLLPCAWVDARSERLPHPLTLTGLAIAVLWRAIPWRAVSGLDAAGVDVSAPALSTPALFAQALCVGAAALWLHHHRRPDGRYALGGGDVPLLVGLTLLCPLLLAFGLVYALLSMIAGRLLRRSGRPHEPMTLAPALCVGWALGWGMLRAAQFHAIGADGLRLLDLLC